MFSLYVYVYVYEKLKSDFNRSETIWTSLVEGQIYTICATLFFNSGKQWLRFL